MKDYTLFSAKDFVLDEYFQSWVFNPVESTDSFWQTWIEEYPHKLNDIEEARSILQQFNFTHHNLESKEVSALWSEIKKADAGKNSHPAAHTSKFLIWSGAVAAMLIVGISSFFWVANESSIEYRTAFGETKKIILPDSSTVILNSNSSLKLNREWMAKSEREVWLDGEAFFTVIHTINNQPFKVRTKEDVAIEVLGTTFNVYHRKETKIVLNSGRIQLSLPMVKTKEKIFMKPGDLVEYDEKRYVKRKVDPKAYTAWTENNLVLDRTSLREMVQLIKDNYGIDVDVKENLLSATISGSMPVTDAENLIQQIAKSFQLKVVKEGNKIYMRE